MKVNNSLEYLAFHLTYLCANRCPFCYLGDENRIGNPPLAKIKQVLTKIAKNDVKEVLFLGGDVCIYPHLKEVVKQAKKLGLKVSIMSNTLSFKDLEFFAKNVDEFETTILGTEKEHDEEVRRSGAYEILIDNMRKLNNIGKKVTVFLTTHPGNEGKIFKMVKKLVLDENLKMESVSIQRIVPRGRAENTLRYSLKEEHLSQIFKQVEKIKKELKLKVWFEDPFPLCLVPPKYRYLSRVPCLWGFSKGSINFNGDLSRCGADNRFSLGNVFEIKDLQKYWRDNAVLTDFRNRKWLPEKCQKCDLLERCGGGCALSRITEGDHERDILWSK